MASNSKWDLSFSFEILVIAVFTFSVIIPLKIVLACLLQSLNCPNYLIKKSFCLQLLPQNYLLKLLELEL